jgi:hypothetical protein
MVFTALASIPTLVRTPVGSRFVWWRATKRGAAAQPALEGQSCQRSQSNRGGTTLTFNPDDREL